MFATRSYSTPRKYKKAWATLIQQHLDAGRICPSNSAHVSPAFLILKSDTLVLPRWVNDYHAVISIYCSKTVNHRLTGPGKMVKLCLLFVGRFSNIQFD